MEFVKFFGILIASTIINQKYNEALLVVPAFGAAAYFLSGNSATIAEGIILGIFLGAPKEEEMYSAPEIRRRYGRLFDIIGTGMIIYGLIKAVF